MTVRSGVLCRAVTVGNTALLLGTVPAGKTWVVKDWRLWNSTAGTLNCRLYVLDPTGLIRGIITKPSLPADGISNPSLAFFLAAGPGDTVWVLADAAGIHVWLSGAVLNGNI